MHHVSPAPALTMMATQSVPPAPYQDTPPVSVPWHPWDPPKPSPHPLFSIAAVPGAAPDPQTQLEADKRAVYRHPLFPLLTLLFEKCEQATQGSECITSASFDVDIENFVHQQEQEHKPFFSDDPELDNLMVKAIQVLRIHLLELEKVNELCKDFCNRYITCLKTKMHSDNLLRNDLGGPYSPSQASLNLHPQVKFRKKRSHKSGAGSSPAVPGIGGKWRNPEKGGISGAVSPPPAPFPTGGALYQPVTMVTSQGQVLAQAIAPGALQIPNAQVNLDLTSLLDGEDKKSKNKRGVLPKHATNIMRSWLFQHLMHPYPTEDEKRQIAAQTNLTLLQVNNWFINARRRILQPMLDASNPDPAPKAKKIKSQHRPTQRFWPNSIAAGVLQQQGGNSGTNPDGSLGMDNLQPLSSATATTMAMQQAMLAAHDDSLDGTEEDEDDEEDEDEMEEDEDEEEELEEEPGGALALDHSDSLE
ncbi:Homeobox protein PKNOX2 [Tinamus guttatus]|uniref:Homeobox protein PKNOX2 n=1 Tax=Tinamus guttatus TaxID=94827 RepID=A0A099ZNZ2_TINGU|nr:Homeobox protein PKNOX2 [Tinamus guttatus]